MKPNKPKKIKLEDLKDLIPLIEELEKIVLEKDTFEEKQEPKTWVLNYCKEEMIFHNAVMEYIPGHRDPKYVLIRTLDSIHIFGYHSLDYMYEQKMDNVSK